MKIVLSVLKFKTSDYPTGIFKHFLGGFRVSHNDKIRGKKVRYNMLKDSEWKCTVWWLYVYMYSYIQGNSSITGARNKFDFLIYRWSCIKRESNQHGLHQLVLETLSCLSRNRIVYTVQFVDKRLTRHDRNYWYLRPLSTIFHMHSGKQQEYPYETNPLS